MSKQVSMNELLPNEVKERVRNFLDVAYLEQKNLEHLRPVRNRHEGYGLLSEAYVNVCGSMDGVKTAMKDCLKMLGGNDDSFQNAADMTYASLLELSITAIQMGVEALNITWQITERRKNEPLPLLEALDVGADEVSPNDSLDDNMEDLLDVDV